MGIKKKYKNKLPILLAFILGFSSGFGINKTDLMKNREIAKILKKCPKPLQNMIREQLK